MTIPLGGLGTRLGFFQTEKIQCGNSYIISLGPHQIFIHSGLMQLISTQIYPNYHPNERKAKKGLALGTKI